MEPVRFECTHRDWNPLKGFEDLCPPDPVFVLRCVETNIVVAHTDLQKAYDRLVEARKQKKQAPVE